MKCGLHVGAHSASCTGPKSGVTSATDPFNIIVNDCVRCSSTALPAAATAWIAIQPHSDITRIVFTCITISEYTNRSRIKIVLTERAFLEFMQKALGCLPPTKGMDRKSPHLISKPPTIRQRMRRERRHKRFSGLTSSEPPAGSSSFELRH